MATPSSKFQKMLPYFFCYNQTNYARWGVIYINEMHRLPEDVKREFEAGNFVVKRSSCRFNQVDPDHSQEWLNGVGKKTGGIIGITKTISALCRWALSFNLGSLLSMDTYILSGFGSGDDYTHNESLKGRKSVDSKNEDALVFALQKNGLFSHEQPNDLPPKTSQQRTSKKTCWKQERKVKVNWKNLLQNNFCLAKQETLPLEID